MDSDHSHTSSLLCDTKQQPRGDRETHDTTARQELDLSEVFFLLDGHRIQEDCEAVLPTHCFGRAGVLRYYRESESQMLDSRTVLPSSQPPMESPVRCEYCGERARPSLDQAWVEEPETLTLTQFCCVQHQQLCDMVVHQRRLAQEKFDQGTGASPLLDKQPTTEQERLLFQGQEKEQRRKRKPVRVYQDISTHPPVAETNIPPSNVLSFRLSTGPPGKGGWTVTPSPKTEEDQDTENKEEVMPFDDHEPFHFGISRHQEGGGFLQKYYSNGKKFLTVFPDGSAQVFYPSGLLALVIVVTKGKGRVCIVYDDDDHAPKQAIRALFQSNGRATCYHSNGNIWLSVDRLGGQCLDEAGTRVRRWTWSSLGLTPTPLRPVFLALNRSLGVRVLGQERVFVSFLACGQQARFSVGICCAQISLSHPGFLEHMALPLSTNKTAISFSGTLASYVGSQEHGLLLIMHIEI